MSQHLKFIGCEIIYREACLLAARGPHTVDLEFLPKGLHDLPTEEMAARVQAAVDAAGDSCDAVLLGYARCNDGTVGVTAGPVPVVIPRAHDCITLFFGSRSAYREYFDAHPGTYYRTTGWLERGEGIEGEPGGAEGVMSQLGLNRSFQELVDRYGRENAEFIAETMGGGLVHYDNLCYLEMGVCHEALFIQAAREEAEARGWAFDHRQGDLSLLAKLFAGPWDEDFVVLSPGERLVARNDQDVLGSEQTSD